MSIAKQCQSVQTNLEKFKALSRLHTETINLSNANDLQGLSDLMRDFAAHLQGMHGIFLVAILRLTHLGRDEIESWIEVRDEIAKELESRGKDPSKVLEGLYDN